MILITNNGHRVVQTIAERNAIEKRFPNMEVVVRDAIADPVVGGSYEAGYKWNDITLTWVLFYKNSRDDIIFTTETHTIANGKVTTVYVPQNSVVWDVFILDANDLQVANVIPTVTAREIALGSGSYDGMRLVLSYAYGATQAAIQALQGVEGSVVQW